MPLAGTTTMRACCGYQLPRPPSLPSVLKPHRYAPLRSGIQSCTVLASTAAPRLSSGVRSGHGAKLRASPALDVCGDEPWFSRFGMSFAEVYDDFPESVWDICEDSPAEALRSKDQEKNAPLRNCSKLNNRNIKAIDTKFDDGFAEAIVFDKTLCKYGILGCKANVDGMMNQGLYSSGERNTIIQALERIEDDIELGKFKLIDGADVHTSIVEALTDMLGDRAKDLAVQNQFVCCLMMLETWCKNSIDCTMTQLKQLQVALVLLAIKNDGLVLPGDKKIEDNTCLDSLVLDIVKSLEHDASKLRCYLGTISCSSDSVIFLRNSCPDDDVFSKRFPIAMFAELINYRIPDHLIQLLEKFLCPRNLQFLIPTDIEAAYDTILAKFSPVEQMRDHGRVALSKCLNIGYGRAHESPRANEIEDAKHHLFSSANTVGEMLDLSIHFVKNISINMEKAQCSLPRGYDHVIRFAHFLTTKGIALETAYALVHMCLDKQLQPCELTLEGLRQIGFPCDRADYLVQYKGGVFSDFTYRDSCKQMLKWCCKLQIDPATLCS